MSLVVQVFAHKQKFFIHPEGEINVRTALQDDPSRRRDV